MADVPPFWEMSKVCPKWLDVGLVSNQVDVPPFCGFTQKGWTSAPSANELDVPPFWIFHPHDSDVPPFFSKGWHVEQIRKKGWDVNAVAQFAKIPKRVGRRPGGEKGGTGS